MINISYAESDKASFDGSNNENWHACIEHKWMHLSGSYLFVIKSMDIGAEGKINEIHWIFLI